MARNKEFDYDEKLEIVRDLFWQKGYHATSMNDITATMKLNRSSIYDTYGSKRNLFLKSLSNYTDFKEKQYLDASKTKGTAIEKLDYIIRDVVQQTLKDNKACFMVKTIFEMASSDMEVREFLKNKGYFLQSILEKQIIAAQKDGSLKSSVSANIIARYILSSFSSFWSHHILTQDKKEVIEMVDFLLEQIKK